MIFVASVRICRAVAARPFRRERVRGHQLPRGTFRLVGASFNPMRICGLKGVGTTLAALTRFCLAVGSGDFFTRVASRLIFAACFTVSCTALEAVIPALGAGALGSGRISRN